MKEVITKVFFALTLLGMWCAILFTITSNGCNKKLTVEERVIKCKSMGFNDINISIYDNYSSVSCGKK